MRLTAVSVAAIVCALATGAAATPSQDLNQGREAFKHRDFVNAKRILNELVHPRELLAQPDELVEAYVMLGASLVETGRIEDARAEFEHALKLEPERELTSGFYSSEAIRVFDETRAKLAADEKALKDAQKLQEMRAQVEKLRASIQVVELHPYSRNFVPFGAGQFQNETPIRGVIFAATETLTLATSVGTWFYLVNTYGLNARVSREQGISVLRLQRIEVGTGIAFLALYAGGVVDSLLHYKPRVKREFDESLIPAELREPVRAKKPPPAKTSLLDRIHVTPMVSPDTIGIGLGWEN